MKQKNGKWMPIWSALLSASVIGALSGLGQDPVTERTFQYELPERTERWKLILDEEEQPSYVESTTVAPPIDDRDGTLDTTEVVEDWSCFDPLATWESNTPGYAHLQWDNISWQAQTVEETKIVEGKKHCQGGEDPGEKETIVFQRYTKTIEHMRRDCFGDWGDCEYKSRCCGEGGSSENPQCDFDWQICSVFLNFNLGFSKDGTRAGFMRLHQDHPSKQLYTPGALEFRNKGRSVDVLRAPDYTIRQVLSDQYLLEVTVLAEDRFRVDFHLRPEALKRDAEGFIEAEKEPFRQIEIGRPAGESGLNRLEVADRIGGAEPRKADFTWDTEAEIWQLHQESAGYREEVRDYVDGETGGKVKERRLVDSEGKDLKISRWHYRNFPFGERLMKRTEETPDGQIRTEALTFYTDPADKARLGKMKSRTFMDGTWHYYGYDDQGRGNLKITPWKDQPLTGDPEKAVANRFTQRRLEPGTPFYHPDAIVLEERVDILGIPVSKTIWAESETREGGKVEITEKCASPEGELGGLGNQRALRIFYPARENDPASGKLQRVENPNGKVTRYAYTRGRFLGGEGLPGDFIADEAGHHIRTEKMTVPAGSPEGIAGKTVQTVTITDALKRRVLEENRLMTAEGEFDEVLDWSGRAYDTRGRMVLTRNQTGITGEYRYNDCCNKIEWKRDADGVETHLVYDKLNRVTMRSVEVPGREAVENWIDYDALGNVVNQRTVAGDLVQETSSQYDSGGRLVARTAPDGLTTEYRYEDEGRKTTTILPGGATRIDQRYLDGRSKSVTGTSVVAVLSDYGVEADTGNLWSESVFANPDGPRWSRSFTNPLGQNTRSEQPGYGEGIVLANFQKYDDQGRVVSTAGAWIRSEAAAGADRESVEPSLIGAPTLSVYGEGTGELELTGQDIDRNGQLEPDGPDRLVKSESSYEKIGSRWFQVRKSWTWPRQGENAADPVLLSESRQRITGLGAIHEDYGVLVRGSVSLIPGGRTSVSAQAPAEGGQPVLSAQSVVKIYRNRDTATATTVSTSPAGVETIQQSIGGLLESVTQIEDPQDPESRIEYRYDYDAFGRRTETIDPRTGTSKTEYDPQTGRILAQIDPEGRKSIVDYYPADHPSAGRLKSTTDPKGKSQYVAYNPRGQQLAAWGQTDYPIAYQYNEYGETIAHATFTGDPDFNAADPESIRKKISENQPQSAVTKWHYDEATGVLVRKEYADGNGTDYTYTPAGQLKSRLWARSGEDGMRLETKYIYDETTGLLKETGYPASATKNPKTGTLNQVTYTYDRNGRPLEVIDEIGTHQYQYNELGQLTTEHVTPHEIDRTWTIDRTYDPLGRSESVHLQTNPRNPVNPVEIDHRIHYQWDSLGRIASVESLAGKFEYDYNEENPDLLDRMSGPVHRVDYTYERQRNLITSVINTSASSATATARKGNSNERSENVEERSTKSAVQSRYEYRNDALGLRDQISQSGATFDRHSKSNWVDVDYNDRSEVTGAHYREGRLDENFNPENPVNPVRKFAYDYDAIGNRERSVSEISGLKSEVSYKANALNQYESISENQRKSAVQNLVHDEDGNLLQQDHLTMTWNAENRLIAAEHTRDHDNDGQLLKSEHLYNYQGQRVHTKIHSRRTESDVWRLTSDVWTIYDGWNPIAQITDSKLKEVPTRTQLLTWGRDLSGSLQGAGGVGGLLAVTENLGKHHFPVYDANGNIGQLLDQAGQLAAHYEYDPFGNITEMDGAYAAANSWRFSTKPADQVSEWSYYGFRYYMPQTGRWASRDPIEEWGGMNLYGFVGNDGVRGIDHLGLRDLKLWYTSDINKNEIGDCGEISWLTDWRVSPKSGPEGGIVIQEIEFDLKIWKKDVFAIPGNQMELVVDEQDNYWEAWTMWAGTDVVLGSDTWDNGKFDDRKGEMVVKGWARYRDGISRKNLAKIMPKGGGPNATGLNPWRNAFGTRDNPLAPGSDLSSLDRSNLIYREWKIEWDCTCTDATDPNHSEKRKTKLVNLIPSSDRVYFPE